MDDQDIVKMIKEEEERLDQRKKQVEEKVKENNDKFDELTKKKTVVMGMANEIVQEEQQIQESGAKVKILAGQCQATQDKLVQIQNKINTATAEEKQKMAAEAPELQATLKETYEKYQKLDAEYRIKVEGHNDKRRKLHDQMTSLDQEALYGKQMSEVIHIQINELNTQISLLNTKKTTFKSSADYLSQTRNELLAFREEINKEIATIT